MKIASIGLAFQNQNLLTICCQDPNQLFKGVLLCAANAADLTPRSGDYGELACAFC
ncbi:hypothetical protein ABIA96_005651 [Bradyrhizobium sp. LB11.1]